MAIRLGTKAVAALRVEGGVVSGTGITASAYPTSTATAADERMDMKWGEGLPLLSESMSSSITTVDLETLDGKGGITKSDTMSIMPAGNIEVQGTYDGIGTILALATGYEKTRVSAAINADYMPIILDPTALAQSAVVAAGAWDDSGTPFATAVDVGKFIRIDTAGSTFGQVRRISAFTDANTVGITPDWNTTPVSGDVAEMGYFFNHKYVTVPAMHDELITAVNSYYDGDGANHSTDDKLIKRATLGIYKGDSGTIEIWNGCKVDSLDISCNAGELMTISVSLNAFSGVRTTDANSGEWGDRKYASADAKSYSKTNHASALNEPIAFTDLSFCRVGAFSTSADLDSDDNHAISGFSLSLSNNLESSTQTATSGLYKAEPVRSGPKEVSGSFSIPRYTADTWLTWRDNQTELMANLTFIGSTSIASSSGHEFEIRIPKIIVTGVSAPVGGAGVVSQEVTWKAIMPNHATPFGLTNYQDWNTASPDIPMPELWFSLNNFDPWHAFLDTNREY